VVARQQELKMKWKEYIKDNYEVSEVGLVRSIKANRQTTVLKTRIDRYGYEIVTLWVAGKALTRKIHRVVAEAFIPNPNNLETVNHLDGDKLNNNVENLEWLSASENQKEAFRTGLQVIGENRVAGRPVKLTEKDVLEIRSLIDSGCGNSEIGHLFGVTCGCIYSIRMRKSWKHI